MTQAVGQIDQDLPCSRCGYNLRTLQTAGNCPECGHPVQASLDVYASWKFLRPIEIRSGLALLIWAQVIWSLLSLLYAPAKYDEPVLVVMLISHGFRPYTLTLDQGNVSLQNLALHCALAFPSWILAFIATWRITRPLDGLHALRFRGSLLRLAMLATIVLTVAEIGVCSFDNSDRSSATWFVFLLTADAAVQALTGLQVGLIAEIFCRPHLSRALVMTGVYAVLAESLPMIHATVYATSGEAHTIVPWTRALFIIGIYAAAPLALSWPILLWILRNQISRSLLHSPSMSQTTC